MTINCFGLPLRIFRVSAVIFQGTYASTARFTATVTYPTGYRKLHPVAWAPWSPCLKEREITISKTRFDRLVPLLRQAKWRGGRNCEMLAFRSGSGAFPGSSPAPNWAEIKAKT